ncbi:MAG: radical SAM protein [bacterium]
MSQDRSSSFKVLLVNPPAGFSYGILGISRPPLGLAYIAAVLKDCCEVRIVDFNVEKHKMSRFPYGDFDVVGISVDTSRYPIAVEIARRAKDQGATVVMGGPHVSFLDREALETGVVDYVVRNEGEYTFLSLIKALRGKMAAEDLSGISFMSGGDLNRTADSAFIDELDSLPFPARELLPIQLYTERMNGRRMTTVVTSRGCPFNCDFCSSTRFFGVRWRARSAESILSELDLLYQKYNYRAISFVDDNFTLNPERSIELSEKIIARGWDLIWAAMTRVDTVVRHPDMIRVMYRAGFRWTFIGFESGSQEALDGYGKRARVADAPRAMEILNDNGVSVTGAFILGAPGETEQMMKDTISFAKRLDPRRAQFSLLTPYPGSALYARLEKRLITKDWSLYSGLDPTMQLDHVTPDQLRAIQIKAYASFYGRPRKAAQNLSYVRRTLPHAAAFLVGRALALAAGLAYRHVFHTKERLCEIWRSICRVDRPSL